MRLASLLTLKLGIVFRFYVVSSKDGWLPSGTSCSSQASRNAFCVLGKCLEFGEDLTPMYDLTEEAMKDIKKLVVRPRSLRFRRELWVEPPQRVAIEESYLHELVQQMNETHFRNHSRVHTASVNEIAFHEPIDVLEMIPTSEFEAYTSSSGSLNCKIDLALVLFILLLLRRLCE